MSPAIERGAHLVADAIALVETARGLRAASLAVKVQAHEARGARDARTAGRNAQASDEEVHRTVDVLMNRTLCVACLAHETGLDTAAIHAVLAPLSRMFLMRSHGLCAECGEQRLIHHLG
jgi:hypothetical protein